MDDEPRITNVYRFANDMVMVFDQHGQQMPEFQGRADEVLDKIAKHFKGDIVKAVFR
jgi:hypothetical protein